MCRCPGRRGWIVVGAYWAEIDGLSGVRPDQGRCVRPIEQIAQISIPARHHEPVFQGFCHGLSLKLGVVSGGVDDTDVGHEGNRVLGSQIGLAGMEDVCGVNDQEPGVWADCMKHRVVQKPGP